MPLTDDQILEKFCTNPNFGAYFAQNWQAQRTLFCNLARTVHNAGLDWYFTQTNGFDLRFGRKHPQGGGATRVYGIIRRNPEMRLETNNDNLEPIQIIAVNTELTEAAIASLTQDLTNNADRINGRFGAPPPGGARWPDAYGGPPVPNAENQATQEGQQNARKAINRILYGPPGTGKTYELSRIVSDPAYQDTRMVTFHQSYGYEEFVEGLRPKLGVDAEAGQVSYEIRNGIFKELCELARNNPDNWYLMLIDEINRGNISKIFGELITLIEIDKRERESNAVSICLPYSFEQFSVPPNLDIIGTMNTADRSLALLDTALRRRFEFVPMLPDTRDEPGAPLHQLRVRVLNQEIDVRKMLETINMRIEALYDRDHSIGHAYFTELRGLTPEAGWTKLQNIFKNRILPLLEEYFFEDWEKIRLVLADNSKARDFQFIIKDKPEDTAAELFGTNDDEFESLGLRSRYRVQPEAFAKPESYIGIYQPQQN